MDINNFDIQVKNIRVFTNGENKITIQELTEEPKLDGFSRDDVQKGVFKYVYHVISFNKKDAEVTLP